MLGWGMMGFTAALLKDARLLKSKFQLCIFRLRVGLFVRLDDESLGLLFFQLSDISWPLILGSCIASFNFDLYHAFAMLFLFCFFMTASKNIK
jgi:energy-coupling factor transport system substrate-specific component